MRFEQTTNLHPVWPWVRAGLERVLLKSSEDWIPEDVYHHLKAGRASLHIAKEGEQNLGFLIVELVPSIFNPDKKRLNVWICYADPTLGEHYADALIHAPETIAKLDDIAKFFGVTWRLHGRKGWERVLKDVCDVVSVSYERKS